MERVKTQKTTILWTKLHKISNIFSTLVVHTTKTGLNRIKQLVMCIWAITLFSIWTNVQHDVCNVRISFWKVILPIRGRVLYVLYMLATSYLLSRCTTEPGVGHLTSAVAPCKDVWGWLSVNKCRKGWLKPQFHDSVVFPVILDMSSIGDPRHKKL